MTQTKANKFGRKPGRGIRPWLLIPKVLAVGVYFGGVVIAMVLWFRGPTRDSIGSPAANFALELAWIEQLSFLFRLVIVPALLVTIALGLALLLQHPRVLSRMRWWRVKMVCLVIYVPVMHLFMSSRLAGLRDATNAGQTIEGLHLQLSLGFVGTVLYSAWFIYLGRHKPRLGQNIAKALKH